MSKAFELFFVGLDEKCQEVYLPRFHTLVSGASGVGKTEAIRRIIIEMLKAIPDLKIVIFDVKETGRDWSNFGDDVPIFIKTATDPRFLRDLIETSEGRRIDWFFYELSRATENAKTWKDVLKNLEAELEIVKQRYPKGSIREEKIGTLVLYMKTLVEDIEHTKFTNNLELPYQINVVPLNKQTQAFKELAVYSYISEILNRNKFLVVIDEASLLAPRGRGTGCKRVIERLFKAGRQAELFGIVSDQEIVSIDESVRRQCWNWILGMQTELGAQKRTVEQLPIKDVKIEDIATLGVGWFFAVIRTPTETIVKKFYLIPEGVSIEDGKKVVNKELDVNIIMEKLRKIREEKITEDDSMYKQLYEEEKHKREELEKQFADIRTKVYNELKVEFEKKIEETKQEAYRDAMQKVEEIRKQWNIEEYQKTIMQLKDEKASLEAELKKLEPLKTLRESFIKALGIELVSPTVISEKISLEHKDLTVDIRHSEKTVEMTTETQLGQILYCAIKDLPKEGFTMKDLQNSLAEHGWYIGSTSLPPNLAQLVKNGYLVKLKTKPITYRLPTKLKINVRQ